MRPETREATGCVIALLFIALLFAWYRLSPSTMPHQFSDDQLRRLIREELARDGGAR